MRDKTLGMMCDRGGAREMRQETREKARNMRGETSDAVRDKQETRKRS
jgi:hypothetical protein